MNGKDSTRPLWIALNTGSEPFALLNGLSNYCEAVFVAQTLSVSHCSCGTIVKLPEWVTHSCKTVDVCVYELGKWYEMFSLSDSTFALGLGPSSLCLSFTSDNVSYLFFLSCSLFLSQFEGIWLALPTSPFFSKTLSSAGSPAFLISPPLPPYSCFTLIDLAARHQITQFCPSPLNYLDAASYANDVLYRISLFLFSLSLSRLLYVLTHQTTSSLVGFDTWRVGGMKHAASSRSLISLYVRLHQTQTIRVWSSQLSVYKL